MGVLGNVGTYGTVNPLAKNEVGDAIDTNEAMGFKYREEQRLAEAKKKAEDDAKLQQLNEWNKSVKADVTGFNNIDFPVKEYLMRIKQEGGKLTQVLNNSNLPLNERLKAMGQRDAYVSSIDFLKQMPTLLNNTLADLHEGVKTGKYDKESEDRALSAVKAIESGDFKIDPTTGEPVLTVWQRDEKGNAVKLIAEKQPFGDFIKNNLQPDLKSNLEEQIAKYHTEYPASSTKTTDANGTTIFHKGIDATKGSKDWVNATEKAVGILSNEPELKRASKKYKLPITDVDGIASRLRDDLLNGVPTQDENIKDPNLAFQKYKFAKEQKKDEVKRSVFTNESPLRNDVTGSNIEPKDTYSNLVGFEEGKVQFSNLGGAKGYNSGYVTSAGLDKDAKHIFVTAKVLKQHGVKFDKNNKYDFSDEATLKSFTEGDKFNDVTKIYSIDAPELNSLAIKMGYKGTKDLRKELEEANKDEIKKYTSSKKSNKVAMITVVLPNGQSGQIPSDKIDAFMKKHPNAKRQK